MSGKIKMLHIPSIFIDFVTHEKTDIYTIYGRKNVLIFIYNFSKIKITQSTVWLTAIH